MPASRSARRGKSSYILPRVQSWPSRLTAVATRFSRTERFGKICRPSGTRPIPRCATLYDGRPRISSPRNRIEPARAGVSPMIDRTVVVFPMPLRPIKVIISPGSIASETPNSTWLSPEQVSMPSSLRTLSAMDGLLLAEIGIANLRISSNFFRFARCDHASVNQHGDAIGESEHGFHVVLDKQDREFFFQVAQHRHHARRFFRPKPRHRLLTQQQEGACGGGPTG